MNFKTHSVSYQKNHFWPFEGPKRPIEKIHFFWIFFKNFSSSVKNWIYKRLKNLFFKFSKSRNNKLLPAFSLVKKSLKLAAISQYLWCRFLVQNATKSSKSGYEETLPLKEEFPRIWIWTILVRFGPKRTNTKIEF